MTETPPQAPPPGTPPPPPSGWDTEHLKDYRQLRRSRHDSKVAGVAGGLGRHLNVDPTILRVLFVVLAFFGGAGVLLYGVLWLLVPEEGTEDAVINTSDSTRNAVVIAVGILAGLVAIGDSWNGWGPPWGLAVAAVVLLVVMLNRDGRGHGAPPRGSAGHDAGASGPVASGPAGSSPAASGPVSPGAEPRATYPLGYNPGQPPPGYLPDADTGYNPGYPGQQATWMPPAPVPAPHPRRRKSGPLLFGPVLALLTLALGVLGLYDAYGGQVVDSAYPALALTVIGGALVVGAFYGRAGGLALIGFLAAVALPLTAIGGPSFEGDRDIVRRPVTAAAVQDSISVPAGRIQLDLTAVRDLEELDGRTLELDASAGEIEVIVPDDLRVDYQADIEFGGLVETPDGEKDGWGPSSRGVLNDDASTSIELDVDLRFGHIELRQS